MSTKERKDKKGKKDKTTTSNSFEGMFEMMSKCCPGGGGLSDCHSMMDMMMEKFCGPITKKQTGGKN